MKTPAKATRPRKPAIDAGKPAESATKPDIGSALLESKKGPDAVQNLNAESGNAGPPSSPGQGGQCQGTDTPAVTAAGRGLLTTATRQQLLDQYLAQPFPHASEFFLIDKIDRLTQGTQGSEPAYVSMADLLDHAADASKVCSSHVGLVLRAAVRAGGLDRISSPNGRNSRYRLTPMGKRFLEQAKAMRVALWKINPQLSIEEVCAIVQLEGNDTLSHMVAQILQKEKAEVERRRTQLRRAKKLGLPVPVEEPDEESGDDEPTRHAAHPCALKPHERLHPVFQADNVVPPLWAGLLVPTQAQKQSAKSAPRQPITDPA